MIISLSYKLGPVQRTLKPVGDETKTDMPSQRPHHTFQKRTWHPSGTPPAPYAPSPAGGSTSPAPTRQCLWRRHCAPPPSHPPVHARHPGTKARGARALNGRAASHPHSSRPPVPFTGARPDDPRGVEWIGPALIGRSGTRSPRPLGFGFG